MSILMSGGHINAATLENWSSIHVTDGTKSWKAGGQLSGCYVSLSDLRTWDRTASMPKSVPRGLGG